MELELINRDTRELVSGAHEILGVMNAPHGELGHPKAKKELLQSTVEIITGICETAAEVKRILRRRWRASRAHRTAKPRAGVLGHAPFSDPALQEISPDPATCDWSTTCNGLRGRCRSSASTCTSGPQW